MAKLGRRPVIYDPNDLTKKVYVRCDNPLQEDGKRSHRRYDMPVPWIPEGFGKEQIGRYQATDAKYPILKCAEYRPSMHAFRFHIAIGHRFRFLIWGTRSGKTRGGAFEFFRMKMAMPNTLSWVVSPTYSQLQVAWGEFLDMIHATGREDELILKVNNSKHEIKLVGGRVIHFKSADWPDTLRGATVNGVLWMDEAAFIKLEAWYICRQRIATHRSPVIFTTTPNGRNWVWEQAEKAGFPMGDDEYGEYHSEDGMRWISNRPTWHFPWVDKDELEDIKKSKPRVVWMQEWGAKFTANVNTVFANAWKALTWKPPFEEDIPGPNIMGVDLAKQQDFTAVIVMTYRGYVLWSDRWNAVDWDVQKVKILALAVKWNASMIVDRANAGGPIVEDLTKVPGAIVHGVDMNAPQVKTDLITSLQMSFDLNQIWIARPQAEFAPAGNAQLMKELNQYETKLTPGGRLSYSAPAGLHDDYVIALALANWGRLRGMAGTQKLVVAMLSKADMDRRTGRKGLLDGGNPRARIRGARNSKKPTFTPSWMS